MITKPPLSPHWNKEINKLGRKAAPLWLTLLGSAGSPKWVLDSLSQLMAPYSCSRLPHRVLPAEVLELPSSARGLPSPPAGPPGHCHSTTETSSSHLPFWELPPPTLPVWVWLWAPQLSSVQIPGIILMTHFSNANDHFSVLFLQWTPLSQDLCRIHSHFFYSC